MKREMKRAVSPVITTVLLILLVIVLAAIIFLWAKGFNSEAISKSISGSEPRAISLVCDDVKLSATISGSDLSIVNQGNVPVYKVGIRSGNGAQSTITEKEINLGAGSTTVVSDVDTTGIDKIEVIPILLGQKEDNTYEQYSCPKDNWQVITI